MEFVGALVGIASIAMLTLLWKYCDLFEDGNVTKDEDFENSEVFFK